MKQILIVGLILIAQFAFAQIASAQIREENPYPVVSLDLSILIKLPLVMPLRRLTVRINWLLSTS
ncbi:hypothetical protein EYV94_10870 [Puteibacter caeruleilacunae]|nr:hypothetical protein EYV94_10870 [Puteibacter caeruleilacunae]